MSDESTKKSKKRFSVFSTSDGNEVDLSDITSLSWQQLLSTFLYRTNRPGEASEDAIQALKLIAYRSIDILDKFAGERPDLFEKSVGENRRWPIMISAWKEDAINPLDKLSVKLGDALPLKIENKTQDEVYSCIDGAIQTLSNLRECLNHSDTDYPEKVLPDPKVRKKLAELPAFSSEYRNDVAALIADFAMSQDRMKPLVDASAKSIEDVLDERKTKRILNIRVDDPAYMSEIEKMHYDNKLMQIESMPISDGDRRKGLIRFLKTRLKSILR